MSTAAQGAGSSNTENGYMNSSQTNSWKNSTRREWCNLESGYYGALPAYIRSLVKPVYKKTSIGGASQAVESTQDNVFLPCYYEVVSPGNQIEEPFKEEGYIYAYYKNSVANSYKQPIWTTNSKSSRWWLRSPNPNTGVHFLYLDESGYIQRLGMFNNTLGICPHFCM